VTPRAAYLGGDEKNRGPSSPSIAESVKHSDKEERVSRHSHEEEYNDETQVAERGQGDGDEEAVAPGRSQTPSTRSRTLSIVPRSRRRGWFGRFAVIPEVERPYDYSNKTKWTITSVVALAGAVAPMGSAIFYRTNTFTQDAGLGGPD
jgi:hypothetical protein